MESIKLAVKSRETGTKHVLKKMRASAELPGVMYGHGAKNRNLSISYGDFAKAYKTAGESSLLDLEIDGKNPVKVLVKDVQVDPLSGRYSHVDFYEVNLKEKIRTEISLNFIGESPAIKELGGSLVKSLDHVKVECLPTALVHAIDVDISKLKAFNDMIHVGDLAAPAGITILDNPREVVALAEAPITEEELKKMEGGAAPAEVGEIKTEAEIKKAAEDAAKATEKTAEKE